MSVKDPCPLVDFSDVLPADDNSNLCFSFAGPPSTLDHCPEPSEIGPTREPASASSAEQICFLPSGAVDSIFGDEQTKGIIEEETNLTTAEAQASPGTTEIQLHCVPRVNVNRSLLGADYSYKTNHLPCLGTATLLSVVAPEISTNCKDFSVSTSSTTPLAAGHDFNSPCHELGLFANTSAGIGIREVAHADTIAGYLHEDSSIHGSLPVEPRRNKGNEGLCIKPEYSPGREVECTEVAPAHNNTSFDASVATCLTSDGTNGSATSEQASAGSSEAFQRRIRRKPPTTAGLSLNDLKNVFHLKREEAEVRLNLKRTTFSELCRHFEIPKWPYRTLRDAEKRMRNNVKTLSLRGISKTKRRKLEIEQRRLEAVKQLMYDEPSQSMDTNKLDVLLRHVARAERQS